MERFEYAVNLANAEEGGFVVTCRDLPQLVTQGDDLAHACQRRLTPWTKFSRPKCKVASVSLRPPKREKLRGW